MMPKDHGSKKHNASFRDIDGFVFEKDNQILRQVNKSYQTDYDQLIKSGLYSELVRQKLLIPHQEVSLDQSFDNNAYKVLKPQPVDFISYPYEWCFSQLKQAALTTLAIQKVALNYQMSLKDASSFNIQFVAGKATLIDSLSFETFKAQPWVAYRQFCQHFLNPLILMSKVDPSLNRLLSTYLDGLPIQLTSKLLPTISKLNPSIFIHIQLHSVIEKKSQSKKSQLDTQKVSFKKESVLGLINSLESAIHHLKLSRHSSFWSDYIPEQDSYSVKAFKEKEKAILKLYSLTKSKYIWDVGSNDGHFSRLISTKNNRIISFDYDPLSVEKNYLLSKKQSNILPLIMDLTNPTPSLGWRNQERQSILNRGPAETVLALALIHHLVITSNIPFEKVAELFSSLCRYLIIEFVPKNDPQVQEMLLLRKDIFVNYSQDNFESIFGKYFKILQNIPIKGSLRQIYLMQVR